MKKPDMTKEYSEEFDRLRKNRVETSYYKYGSAKDNFGLGIVKSIPSMELCLKKYQDTGNQDYLLDAANYLMFEYMYPQHPKAHFRATSSEESAGIVGMSIKEMEQMRDDLY